MGFFETRAHRLTPSGAFRHSAPYGQGLRAPEPAFSQRLSRSRNIPNERTVAVVAIYSCNLASIGRTTHAAGTAGAHLRYVSREGAEPLVEAHGIPLDPTEARTWMDREEANARANARLVDKVRVAIPRELTGDERIQLVRDFVRDVTGDRVPWLFAIHQSGEDAHNPHAHIVLRDRDLQTGARVLRLSDSARDREKAGLEPKAVEWIRQRWEHHANASLERAGHEERVDRRTLAAQGIDREPTIHIGVRGAQVERHVHQPQSKARKNALGREIDYPAIDQGRTRMDRYAEIVDLNLAKAARSPDFETRTRAKSERHQHQLDRALEKDLSGLARRRTQEDRKMRAAFRERVALLRDLRDSEYKGGAAMHRESLTARVLALRDRQAAERAALARKQQSLWGRIKRVMDVTGGTRRKHSDARLAQIAAHKLERSDLARRSRADWTEFRDALALRFAPRIDGLAEQRREALSRMKEMHMRGEASADAKRQLRERAREQERQRVEEEIRRAKALARDRSATPTATPGGPMADLDRVRGPLRPVREDFERRRRGFGFER